jgi:malonate-semialdehyde dehydrogenase (acetylating)/methylmalonate-semialdehyde dehydrogenase
MTKEISHYVGGRLVQGGGNRSASVYNPATGEVSAQVALASGRAGSGRRSQREGRSSSMSFDNSVAPRPDSQSLPTYPRRASRYAGRGHQRRARQDHFRREGTGTARDEVVEFATGAPQLLKGEVTENVGTRVDHMHGNEGVRFYTMLKTITTRWPTGIRSGADFVMPTME